MRDTVQVEAPRPAQTEAAGRLRQRSVGLAGVLFQSVTFMAPAAAAAASIPVGANFAGGGLPLATIGGLVICLLAASSIGQLAKHLPSAGSIYTYPARGLHPTVGFLVGWGYALVAALVLPTTMLLFGYLVGSAFHDHLGWPVMPFLVAFVVAGCLTIAGLGLYGVRLSTTTGIVLGAFEIAVLLVLAVWMIASAGGHNTLAVFTPEFANVKGFTGSPGLIAGSVYVLLAFVGFEAAAPLAEEARDARRIIPVAVVLSCLAIGVFYVFTTYAASVFVGPAHFESYGQLGGGSPWIAFGQQLWGVGWIAVFLAIANSCLANGNAGAIATTRTWYAMGRIGMLPRALARTHATHQTPHVGLGLQLVLALVVALPLAFVFGPVPAFILLATILTAVMMAIYAVFNVACLAFYLREKRDELNWFLHVAVPVVGVLAILPGLFVALGIGASVVSFIEPLPYPTSLAGPVLAAWFAIGIVYFVYLRVRHPDRLGDLQQVFE